MKRLIAWFLVHVGRPKTVQMIEELKQMGFHHATRAGISLGIDDLRVPPSKPQLLQDASMEINAVQARYEQGYVTIVERLQRVIDTWNGTSERLKDDVVENFLATDPLNPVYMMAFSGARGNLSQVRQLVGMRGLMADSAGEIIDLPVRSNFREGITVTEYIISCYGARKGLVDTALRTANSGYLTRRLVDVAQDVIVRRSNCGTRRGVWVSDMTAKFSSKVMETVEERTVGRVLHRSFLSPAGDMVFLPGVAISQQVASELSRLGARGVPVRSVLTCDLRRGVCRACYGWNLSTGKIVSVGEAVGILAAQSIGEPGTQLTMRTFHTGGVFSGGALDELRAPRAGVVRYTHPVDHKRVRTRHGDEGILTEGTTTVLIEGRRGTSTIRIPSGAIVVAEAGETVRANQLIAEIPSSHGLSDTVRVERAVKTEIDGEVYFDRLSLRVLSDKHRTGQGRVAPKSPSKKSSKVEVRKPQKQTKFGTIVRKDGYVWVLEGHVRAMEMPTTFFAQLGDWIDPQGVLTCSTRMSPLHGTVQGWAQEGKPTAIVSRAFGSLGFEGADAWLPGRPARLRTPEGCLETDASGVTLAPSLYAPATGGVLRYDGASGTPTRCLLVPEEVFTIDPRKGWVVSAISGQSVGPGTSLATRQRAAWQVSNGRLGHQPVSHHASSQAWVQVIAPSLAQMNVGESRCKLVVKPGWAVAVPEGLDPGEGTLAEGSALLASWVFPSQRVLVEPADTHPAVLLRPMSAHPIYPAQHWYDRLVRASWPGHGTSGWHPRPASPGRRLPGRTGDVAVVQRFPYRHGDRVPAGASLVRVGLEWPSGGVGWRPSAYLRPPSGGRGGQLELVHTARVATAITEAAPVTKTHADRPMALRGHGVHRLTPLGQRMVLSEHGGEIVRVIQDRELQTHGEGVFTMTAGSLESRDVDRDIFLGRGMVKRTVTVGAQHLVTLSTGTAPLLVRPYRTIHQGRELARGVSSPVSGMVVEARPGRVTVRLGEPYRASYKSRVAVWPSEVVRAGQTIAHLVYRKTKTGDIVQGLPKVEEILEARRKKGTRRVPCNPYDHVQTLYHRYLKIEPKKRAFHHSVLSMQLRLLRRVQHVYRAQGVQISDKHIEIIVRRMTSRVLVEKGGGTGLLPGELVEHRRVERINKKRERVEYLPVVLGITKAALTTHSFISAASFQETTRVLTQAAMCGKADWLEGLKENVILGRLIPAGVGFYGHKFAPYEMATRRLLLMVVDNPPPTPPRELRGVFHLIEDYWTDLEGLLQPTPAELAAERERLEEEAAAEAAKDYWES